MARFAVADLPPGPFEDGRFFRSAELSRNLFYIEPVAVFCSASSCALGKDYQFYSDAHHLNLAGSEKLKEVLKKIIE